MTLIYGSSVAELALDASAERGDRLTAWRNQRQSELEIGDDVTAILNALPESDWAEYFGDLMQAALTLGDERSSNVSRVMDRLIERTLDFEEARGAWRE